jgi:hypothetical protein
MKINASINGGIVTPGGFGLGSGAAPVRMNDAAIANGNAFLTSELEKRDPLVRQPLTSVTYPRDIPMKTGGGWVEFISALNIDYGISGGSDNSLVSAAGATGVPVIQANFNKDIFSSHVYSAVMRIGFVDMQRMQVTGQSLDKMLTDGIRLSYDKHMDANTYTGMTAYGTTGLVNNAAVTAAAVANNAAGTAKTWVTKTPDEILADVNGLITATWAQAEYDLAALPNHILLPYAQYNYLATTKVSTLAEKTILTFILENNISTQNGGSLVIAATRYCAGAGTGSTDRMVCYVHNDRFIAMEELVPLARTMTQPNVDALAYDSVYMANVSQVEFFYTATVRYADGI